MFEVIILFLLGIILILIGISNRKGNLSLIHSYHYKRVSKNDIIPFGKKIGLGAIIIGISIIITAISSYIYYVTNKEIFETISIIILITSFVIGFIIIFYAMIKYNKGIF